MHQAKGLEFNHVFVVSFNDGVMPLTRGDLRDGGDDDDGDYVEDGDGVEHIPRRDYAGEEERRIAYVALSRAKTRLYISWVQHAGDGSRMTPSPFLDAIPRYGG